MRAFTGPPHLTISDLVGAFSAYRGRFSEIFTFADDLKEVVALGKGEKPARIFPRGACFSITEGSQTYELKLFKGGIVRLKEGAPSSNGMPVEVQHIIEEARVKKGYGWDGMLILGMFARPQDHKLFKRILTLRFDIDSRRWLPYDGGLVTWMKSEFLSVS